MKVSIVTISFNSVRTIEKTILSVLKQTYNNIEYIIIDGGSTDGTVDIIKKYQNKIKYWESEKDKGISDAFNKGIKLATGEIIGILNSDDWYELGTIKTVVSKLSDPEIDYLVGSIRYWDECGNNFIVLPDKKYQDEIRYKMPKLNHPASIFKRKVYESVGTFDINYRYAMDYDFFLRVFLANMHADFTNTVLTNMNSAGASDKHAIIAYKESYKIAPDKFRAGLFFIYATCKYYLRKLLSKIGLDSLTISIRKIKYKNNS